MFQVSDKLIESYSSYIDFFHNVLHIIFARLPFTHFLYLSTSNHQPAGGQTCQLRDSPIILRKRELGVNFFSLSHRMDYYFSQNVMFSISVRIRNNLAVFMKSTRISSLLGKTVTF